MLRRAQYFFLAVGLGLTVQGLVNFVTTSGDATVFFAGATIFLWAFVIMVFEERKEEQ